MSTLLWLLSIYNFTTAFWKESHVPVPPSPPTLSFIHWLGLATNNVLCIHSCFQGNTLHSLVKLSHIMDGVLKLSL